MRKSDMKRTVCLLALFHPLIHVQKENFFNACVVDINVTGCKNQRHANPVAGSEHRDVGSGACRCVYDRLRGCDKVKS